MKKLLIVVPHPDDEVLLAGSFLYNWDGEVKIIFSHVHDVTFNKRVSIIDKSDNRFIMADTPREVLSILEDECKDHIDCLIYPKVSYHPSHTECNSIVRQIMRDPFKDRINTILEAGHANSEFNGDMEYNYYSPISSEIMDKMKSKLDEYKLEGWYGKDNFEGMMRYHGSAIGEKYAQPFLIKKMVR